MIIVTGGCGFIGSNLIKYLKLKGHTDILSVDYVPRSYNLDIQYTPAEHFLQYIEKFKDIEMIFHEGAISSTTETDTKKLFKQNVEYTYHLMYYCRDKGIPLQYASSASVYGNPTFEEWQLPSKKINPLNEYAKSKSQVDYIGEMIVGSQKPPKLFQGMRYFNVYGPNEDHKEDQASPYHKFTKQFEETGRIKLFEGSKEFYRDFISVEEVIEKKIYCLENKSSGIYDVGTGTPKSFYDVAIEICKSEEYIDWVPMPDNLKQHYQKYTKANMDWYYSNL